MRRAGSALAAVDRLGHFGEFHRGGGRVMLSLLVVAATLAACDCGDSDCPGGAACRAYRATPRGTNYLHLRPNSLYNAMPQTCYGPRFGCYPGNNRNLHRYPAFHGTHYRRPYHYRHLYEYPWHAEPHDPLPLTPSGAEGSIVGVEYGDPNSGGMAPGPAAPLQQFDGEVGEAGEAAAEQALRIRGPIRSANFPLDQTSSTRRARLRR